MKIQIITNLFPVPWAPQRAAFNRQQFAHLAKSNEVRVLIPVPWNEARAHKALLKPYREENIDVDFAVYFYPPGIMRRYYPLFLGAGLASSVADIRRFSPDCFLLSWAFPDAVAGAAIARKLGIAYVVKTHGSDINMHAQVAPRAKQISKVMCGARAVVAVSEDLRLKIIKLGVPEKLVKTVYNGINKQVFYARDRAECRKALKLEPHKPYILYVGNLKIPKGCNDLLEAFIKLAEDHQDAELVYIGGGDQKDHLQARAQSAGLGERVRFCGSLGHEAIACWMNASDLVALPSENEGVPNVLLEAMSCGTPVVATRVGGIPEVVPDGSGIMVEYGDKEELARALVTAIATQWDRQAISAAMASYSWEKNTQYMQTLLESGVS